MSERGGARVRQAMGGNRLFSALPAAERALIIPHLDIVLLSPSEVLFEPGDDIETTHFPVEGAVVSMVVALSDGRLAEAASIGCEGAVGGIVSAGDKPAFTRAVVQAPGVALKMLTAKLEDLKASNRQFENVFARYADALLAQIMQSVACNALHPLDERCARWLLALQDRVGRDRIPVTQEGLSQMLGVQRTTVSRIAGQMRDRGLISYSRGVLTVLDRKGLEQAACECYRTVEDHFHRVLPRAPEIISATG